MSCCCFDLQFNLANLVLDAEINADQFELKKSSTCFPTEIVTSDRLDQLPRSNFGPSFLDSHLELDLETFTVDYTYRPLLVPIVTVPGSVSKSIHDSGWPGGHVSQQEIFLLKKSIAFYL
jgi:hypothetical protein